MKFDFHIHSKGSFDCMLSLQEIIKQAKKKGLDGIAVADHNSVSMFSEIDRINLSEKNFIIIKAQEISNLQDNHIIGLFLTKQIMPGRTEQILKQIRAQNGIAVIPHPLRLISGMNEKEIQTNIALIDAIEVLNGKSKSLYETKKALEIAKKYQKPMIAGSDAHRLHEIGSAVAELEIKSLTPEEIKKAILEKRTKIAGKNFPPGKTVPQKIFLAIETIIRKNDFLLRNRFSHKIISSGYSVYKKIFWK